MPNSTEHEISIALKNKITKKIRSSCFKSLRLCIYHVKMQTIDGILTYEPDKFCAQLS